MLSPEDQYEQDQEKWSHALPLVPGKANLLAEIEYLRSLFMDCLPIGENTEDI